MAAQTSTVVTYTHNSCNASRLVRRYGFLWLIVVTAICSSPFSSGPAWPHDRWSESSNSSFCLLFFPLVLAFVWLTIPWSLTLDYSKGTHSSKFGYRPLIQRRSGPLTEIGNVLITSGSKSENVLVVCFPFRTIKSQFWLHSSVKYDELASEADKLFGALGLTGSNVSFPSNPDGRDASIAGYRESDCKLYTNLTVSFGSKARAFLRAGICIAAVTFGIMLLLPCFYDGDDLKQALLDASGTAGLIEIPVVISLFLYKPFIASWRLSMNYVGRSYCLIEGWEPFASQHSGTFEDFSGVRFTKCVEVEFDKRCIVSLALKNRPDHKIFPVHQAENGERAEELANELRKAAGIGVADSLGNTVKDYEARFNSENTIAYSNKSRKSKYSARQLITTSALLFLSPIAFFPILPNQPASVRGPEAVKYFVISFIFWMAAYYCMKAAVPWVLSLDYVNNSYCVTEGFSRFRERSKGLFKELHGVTVFDVSDQWHNDPFDIAISIKGGLEMRYYRIETAHCPSEADRRAKELSARLGIPIINTLPEPAFN